MLTRRTNPARRHRFATAEWLRWAPLETRLFRGIGVLSERGVCRLQLVESLDARSEYELAAWARKRCPSAELRRDERALAPLARLLHEYAAGKRRSFDLALDLGGTAFQRQVWHGLLEIPFGAIESYGELAARIGQRGAARAVGSANGANPVPILVPCHRVVSGDSIGGYGLGLALKRALLDLEGVTGYEQGTRRLISGPLKF
jgi:O-6-methylguanine DNA methyltransferase